MVDVVKAGKRKSTHQQSDTTNNQSFSPKFPISKSLSTVPGLVTNGMFVRLSVCLCVFGSACIVWTSYMHGHISYWSNTRHQKHTNGMDDGRCLRS